MSRKEDQELKAILGYIVGAHLKGRKRKMLKVYLICCLAYVEIFKIQNAFVRFIQKVSSARTGT